MQNASTWAENALAGLVEAGAEARNRLAADAIELRMLPTHLAYDTSKLQTLTRWVVELERRMVLSLPLLSSVSDRMAALLAAGDVTWCCFRKRSDELRRRKVISIAGTESREGESYGEA